MNKGCPELTLLARVKEEQSHSLDAKLILGHPVQNNETEM